MKLAIKNSKSGFTLSEMSVSLGIATVLLAATITASVGLQKSFNAVDRYFATHMQQIRIIDYLGRDVKRGLAVTTSVDLQTVTVSVPRYIIEAGDAEAIANPALIGTPRAPSITNTPSGKQVNYGSTVTSVVYAINGSTIERTENGNVTTIASATDQLVPQTTDVELANTEYARTSVTFRPIFSSGNEAASRTGTTVYSTSYLRNRRRG